MTDTVQNVIDLYLKLRRKKEAIEAKTKEKLVALREDMTALESWLLEQADSDGVKSFRTDAGTAFIAVQDSATVADWDKTLPFIIENEAWGFVDKKVSKVAVRQYIEENGSPPPGVNFSSRRTINVRSPSPE